MFGAGQGERIDVLIVNNKIISEKMNSSTRNHEIEIIITKYKPHINLTYIIAAYMQKSNE